MITDDQYFNGIDKFQYLKKLSEIPLIGTLKIDNLLYGRFDIIINKYYNGFKKYIEPLMDFNKISDPTEVKIGMIIELPDFQTLEQQTKIIGDLEDSDIQLPGILKDISNSQNNSNAGVSSTQSVASPKLKISLEQVSYDAESGKIKY